MFEVENLQVSYGQSQVIHDISFNVAKNETLAIMGRNGMGKTTLFKSLMGILPSQSGKVSIEGTDVGSMEWDCLCATGKNDFSNINGAGKYRNRSAGVENETYSG